MAGMIVPSGRVEKAKDGWQVRTFALVVLNHLLTYMMVPRSSMVPPHTVCFKASFAL